MARKAAPKNNPAKKRPSLSENVEIAGAGIVIETPITATLEKNYMPYAMSVIVSRALPDIDGFKPAHRKLLYTMYEMGLLNGAFTKSANIVGATMRLNPHGDQAIYDTMVRLSRGNETLLTPFVESKGNFGKAYSRDMAYAASRYTEAKLAPICKEVFGDIDKETVDFVDNYDSTRKEPSLLPVSFPSILANNTLGIAVGMASSICSFNLPELCEATIALMGDENHDLTTTLKGPDFIGGGYYLYDEAELRRVFETGRGSLRIRAKYNFLQGENMIEITQIPPTTTIEAVMDKIADLVKLGKVKEINDMRDETDLNGLKLTLDLKRGTDPERLMQKLFRSTPLEDTFSCNFNMLIAGVPQVLGVRAILDEWIAFRTECVRRRTYYDKVGKEKRLHLLKGLAAILLDIDKAIRIVRETQEEAEVIPNLMIGFGIDEAQAEYVAEIRLRNLNHAYILKRSSEIETLEKETAELAAILASKTKIKNIIIKELQAVAKQYGQARKTEVMYEKLATFEDEPEEELPTYPVHVFFTREGYIKKITPQSLRMSGEHKLKDGDEITQTVQTKNDAHLLFFTNKAQVYKTRAADFEDTKASVMGTFLPARLEMEEGEEPLFMVVTEKYSGSILIFFENGKGARVPLSAYETKTNRRKLINAYAAKVPPVAFFHLEAEMEFAIETGAGRLLLVNSAQIPEKTTKSTAGVAVLSLKKNDEIKSVKTATEYELVNPARYRVRNLPGAGAVLKTEDIAQQTTF
ncbi:DNA topoisomerase (ATP-hydrolyzing) subunit A [Ruminococcaceae bacterium OttesenSCG-928-N02]|nr:DNA topoisomerase (ATP-hydrolyzing) subunit A [Ruminococcaceae bacterium OttesenSCG-928-N02]